METQTRRLPGIALVLVLIVIVVAGFAWMRSGTEADAPAADTSPPTPAPVAVRAPPAPKRVPDRAPLPASIATSGLLLSEQVKHLLATQAPQDAYTAYFLISACTMFNRKHDLTLYDDKLRAGRAMTADERRHMTGMCGAMTERERQARLDYLAIAVKAGIPGAAWSYAAEGPFGDPSALQTRPDDALVQAWKQTARAQLVDAAEAGDPITLVTWGVQNISGSDLAARDPVLGYGYLLAFGLIDAYRNGPNSPGALAYRDDSAMMNALAGDLTPEQRAVALAAAQRIAQRAKRRR